MKFDMSDWWLSPDVVLRGIADFAGLPFDPTMLNHRATARSRGLISSPSNVQVTEPLLYERSIGRWRRYRKSLEPVLGLLRPVVRRIWLRPLGKRSFIEK